MASLFAFNRAKLTDRFELHSQLGVHLCAITWLDEMTSLTNQYLEFITIASECHTSRLKKRRKKRNRRKSVCFRSFIKMESSSNCSMQIMLIILLAIQSEQFALKFSQVQCKTIGRISRQVAQEDDLLPFRHQKAHLTLEDNVKLLNDQLELENRNLNQIMSPYNRFAFDPSASSGDRPESNINKNAVKLTSNTMQNTNSVINQQQGKFFVFAIYFK